jgi:transposase
VVAKAVPNAKRSCPTFSKKGLPESTVYTYEYSAYERLNRDGYRHSRVDPAEEIYIAGNVHTNAIDSFWYLLKRGIGGVYHSVAAKTAGISGRVRFPVPITGKTSRRCSL